MPIKGPKEIKHAIITFLECSLVGGWKTVDYDPLGEIPETRAELLLLKAKNLWTVYKAWKEPAEILLVRPDELVRRFSFRNKSIVYVGQSAVKFRQIELLEELSVDQDVQEGKRPKSKGYLQIKKTKISLFSLVIKIIYPFNQFFTFQSFVMLTAQYNKN